MNRAGWILLVLLSHWKRHRAQLATLSVGLISATALWSGVQALNQQARSSYDRAAAVFGGANTAMLVSRDGRAFSQQLFVDLRRGNWLVSPVVEGRVRIDGRSYRLIGIEPITFPKVAGSVPGVGQEQLQNFLTAPRQTLAAPETILDLKSKEGRTLVVEGGDLLPPLAVQDKIAPGVLIVDISIAQVVLKVPNQVTRLLVEQQGTEGRKSLTGIATDKLLLVEPGASSDIARLTSSFHLNLTAFGFLSFFVGLFIVHSAIGLALEQRLPMLRTLRACGVSAKMLTGVLVAELLSLAIVSGFVGLICGYFVASFLLPDVAASLRGLYGAQIPGQLSLRLEWWIAGLGMSIFGAISAAANGLFRVYRMPVLAAALPYAWRQAQEQWLKRQGALAFVVILISAGAFYCGDSLASGFVVLASMLLAAALALPVMLGVILSLGQSVAVRPLVRWFWSDSRQQLSGLSLSLMALLLALAVNVGVGTMVQSFSKTFTSWLDNRLAAEVYLNAQNDEQAREIVTWLRERPDVEAILPSWRTDIVVGDLPVEVLGFADHATYRERWPLLESKPNSWDEVRAGRAVMFSEQLARRLKLRIGDTISLPTLNGSWPVEISGIYPDYGNAKGQIGVDIDALSLHWPDIGRTRFGLRVVPEKVSDLVSAMREKFGLDSGRLVDQLTLKAESIRIFNRTFAVTTALNAFTLGVAGIALLTSLLTLANSRLPHLAPLWALGITRRKLASIELLKTMSVAFLTAMLALPLGLLVAWSLIAIVNVKAFGWRLPFYVFPLQLLELFATAMFAALVAAFIPVLKLMKLQPANLVKIFTNER